MRKPKKAKKKPAKRVTPATKARLQIKISPLFKRDLKSLSNRKASIIKKVLAEGAGEDVFRPGRKFKVLRTYKGRKIWYLRAGDDVRLTAHYAENGDLWLLSIESHDTLGNAPERVIEQVRKISK